MTVLTGAIAEALLPDVDDGDVILAVHAQLDAWLLEQAGYVRQLGPTNQTRALLSLSENNGTVRICCEFYALTGDLTWFAIIANGNLSFAPQTAEVPDVGVGAAVAAALLEQLGMTAALQPAI